MKRQQPSSQPPVAPEVHYWQQFEKLLAQKADQQDWSALRLINRKMIMALKKRGKPRNNAELKARQALEKRHQQAILLMEADKNRLQQAMQTFVTQQDGISAYMMTALVAGDSVDNFPTIGIAPQDEY